LLVYSLCCFFTFSLCFFKPLLEFLVPRFTQNEIFAICSIGIHTGLSIIVNGTFYFIYKAKIPFFERYRVLQTPWPWEADPEKWRATIKKTMKSLLFEHFVIIPALLLLEACTVGTNMSYDLDSYPSVAEMTSQLIFLGIVGDTWFYWSHRTLHHPKIYPIVHKQHHEYSHTISLAAEYAHPIEFILGNVMPVTIGTKLLGSQIHIMTYCMFGIIALGASMDGHCGYDFSWSPYGLPPFSGSSHYHNFHHSKNVGNYISFFTFWDTVCGTNKAYYRHVEKEELVAKSKKTKKEDQKEKTH